MAETRTQYEASLSEAGEGGPARLYLWIRRFQDGEELTGRYEVFSDLPRLDAFLDRLAAGGEDTAALREARQRFAAALAEPA